MMNDITSVAGIEIPSIDPLFLAVVLVVHIPLGLVSVVVGVFAMLSKKQRGRHSTFGIEPSFSWMMDLRQAPRCGPR